MLNLLNTLKFELIFMNVYSTANIWVLPNLPLYSSCWARDACWQLENLGIHRWHYSIIILQHCNLLPPQDALTHASHVELTRTFFVLQNSGKDFISQLIQYICIILSASTSSHMNVFILFITGRTCNYYLTSRKSFW